MKKDKPRTPNNMLADYGKAWAEIEDAVLRARVGVVSIDKDGPGSHESTRRSRRTNMKKIRRKKEPKPSRDWRYILNRPLTFAEEVIILVVLVLFIIIIAIIT